MKAKKTNYIYLLFILFVLKDSEFKAQNLNWVRKVAASAINDVCTDDNNRQYSISYGNYLSNFSFNGNQITSPTNYTCGALIKSNPSGNHEWINFFNPVGAAYGSCVPNRIIYNAGHIYITGVINGSIDLNPGAAVNSVNGMNNSFVVKLDTAGNFVWGKSFGENNTKVYDLKVDAIGNVLMTGSFSTSFYFNGVNQIPISNGNNDIFLLKFNNQGQEQWCKTFGSIQNGEAGKSIAIDQNNNINLCGYFSGNVDFDPGPGIFSLIGNSTNASTNDGFVARYDSNGNFVTAISIGGIGGNNTARFNSIEVHNNSVYVAGLVYGTVDLDPGALTNNITVQGFVGILLKFDYQLNPNWHKLIISSNGQSEIYQIRIKSNQLYISGIMSGTTDLDPHPTNSFTYTPAATYNAGNTYVVKMDLNGNFVWGAGFLNTPTGGIYTNSNIPNGLAITNDGVYIAGEFTGPVDFNPDQNITQITQSQLTNAGIGVTTGYLVKLEDCNITNSSIQVNACNTYTWAQNGQTYNTSGVFQDTLQNVSGCDSIVSLNLTISPNVVGGTTTQTACNSYTWNNQTYTQSGIFTQVLSTINGCDSTATLDLTLNFAPVTPLITLTNVTDLSTPLQGNASYQWFKCSDNLAIPNAINNTFIASSNGLYGVIVSNGCGSDTSQCVNVSTIGMNELSSQIVLFPNPTTETIEIRMDNTELQNVNYKLIDAASREIQKGKLDSYNGRFLINTKSIATGNYILVIEGVGTYKFIKN
ncbi:MAG: T9SS C-terminal target domain-containing protein [Flavobacteriia bacterium]|nr:T9SS C-terminal target domain-containing protein [Flavobacteriia bacterium]